MNGNKGRRGGAQPGSGRPRLWSLIDGEPPHLMSLRVPESVAKETQLMALLLDKKDPRAIAFFASLEQTDASSNSVD